MLGINNKKYWLFRLENEKTRTRTKIQAETQTQVQDEISRILSAERALAQESLQQAVIRERLATEDEKRRAELFVSLSLNSVKVAATVICTYRLTWSLSNGTTVSKTGRKLEALAYWFLHFWACSFAQTNGSEMISPESTGCVQETDKCQGCECITVSTSSNLETNPAALQNVKLYVCVIVS